MNARYHAYNTFVDVIKKSTSCERIIHLWMLSPHELCYQLGLSKEELDSLLDEMKKISNIIGEESLRYRNHISRCKKYYSETKTLKNAYDN